ncbi:MAG: biotin carboxylase N-terminal domain-containing protein [Actinomycetota bacterium]
MLARVLVANRGEIACRVIATCRRLGVATVAVYSDADRDAMHVRMADEAYRIGPAPAGQSYLDVAAIVAAARRSGADAVHPGYGFLAESADAAEAIGRAGLVFVGPPPSAIRAMGSKREARALMARAGVPLLPGHDGDDGDPESVRRAALAVGFPVLLKASAGGGGRGMRVVESEGELADAIAGARREAESAFGDGRLIVERYLPRARHVEVQVLADRHGNAIHLGERDCSVQRRHQKVIEEAPAPDVPDAVRAGLCDAALDAARAVGYEGAGTVEFLLAGDGTFAFIEMNTRIQVEHPVTEMVTGVDLVEWQLRVAAGEPLAIRQEDVVPRGHAIEARLYAEDPERDLLPASGRIAHLRLPAASAHVRVDAGAAAGETVGVHYDALLAKVVAFDRDRDAALRRLRAALAGCEVAGVATNLPFLRAVAAHPALAAGPVDTTFVERHRAELLPARAAAPPDAVAVAALAVVMGRERAAAERARVSPDPHSPWHTTGGWRLSSDAAPQEVRLHDGVSEVAVEVGGATGRYLLHTASGPVEARAAVDGDTGLAVEIGGQRRRATVLTADDEVTVVLDGRTHRFALAGSAAPDSGREAAAGGLTAPMPAQVTSVLVAEGDDVAAGDALMTLEAMKIEVTVRAPAPGRVARVHYPAGAQVEEGAVLVTLDGGEPA